MLGQAKILIELKNPAGDIQVSDVSELKHFIVYQRILYWCGPDGMLAHCVNTNEAKTRLQQVHEQSYGVGDVRLYRKIPRQGTRTQQNFIEAPLDWRLPSIDYLVE